MCRSDSDSVVYEAGEHVVQTQPQKFWFRKSGQNPWKSGKNCYLGKISENPGINGDQRLQKNNWRPSFGGHTKKGSSWSLWEKFCKQTPQNNVPGKFEEIRAKNLRTPKNLLAPTLMLRLNDKTVFFTRREGDVKSLMKTLRFHIIVIERSQYMFKSSKNI